MAGDARGLDLGRRFELITLTGHAFQCFLTDEDVGALLSTARRHLAPGGALVFDSRNPAARCWEGWTPERTRRPVAMPGGPGWVEMAARFDPSAEIVTYTQRFGLPDGSVRETSARLRSTTRERIEAMLKAADLRATEVFGDWGGAPWSPASPEIVVVAAAPD